MSVNNNYGGFEQFNIDESEFLYNGPGEHEQLWQPGYTYGLDLQTGNLGLGQNPHQQPLTLSALPHHSAPPGQGQGHGFGLGQAPYVEVLDAGPGYQSQPLALQQPKQPPPRGQVAPGIYAQPQKKGQSNQQPAQPPYAGETLGGLPPLMGLGGPTQPPAQGALAGLGDTGSGAKGPLGGMKLPTSGAAGSGGYGLGLGATSTDSSMGLGGQHAYAQPLSLSQGQYGGSLSGISSSQYGNVSTSSLGGYSTPQGSYQQQQPTPPVAQQKQPAKQQSGLSGSYAPSLGSLGGGGLGANKQGLGLGDGGLGWRGDLDLGHGYLETPLQQQLPQQGPPPQQKKGPGPPKRQQSMGQQPPPQQPQQAAPAPQRKASTGGGGRQAKPPTPGGQKAGAGPQGQRAEDFTLGQAQQGRGPEMGGYEDEGGLDYEYGYYHQGFAQQHHPAQQPQQRPSQGQPPAHTQPQPQPQVQPQRHMQQQPPQAQQQRSAPASQQTPQPSPRQAPLAPPPQRQPPPPGQQQAPARPQQQPPPPQQQQHPGQQAPQPQPQQRPPAQVPPPAQQQRLPQQPAQRGQQQPGHPHDPTMPLPQGGSSWQKDPTPPQQPTGATKRRNSRAGPEGRPDKDGPKGPADKRPKRQHSNSVEAGPDGAKGWGQGIEQGVASYGFVDGYPGQTQGWGPAKQGGGPGWAGWEHEHGLRVESPGQEGPDDDVDMLPMQRQRPDPRAMPPQQQQHRSWDGGPAQKPPQQQPTPTQKPQQQQPTPTQKPQQQQPTPTQRPQQQQQPISIQKAVQPQTQPPLAQRPQQQQQQQQQQQHQQPQPQQKTPTQKPTQQPPTPTQKTAQPQPQVPLAQKPIQQSQSPQVGQPGQPPAMGPAVRRPTQPQALGQDQLKEAPPPQQRGPARPDPHTEQATGPVKAGTEGVRGQTEGGMQGKPSQAAQQQGADQDQDGDAPASPTKGPRSRRKKAEGEPKRPVTAYTRYQKEVRKDVMKMHPGLKMTEVNRIIKGMWDELGEDERVPFQEAYEHDLEVYQEEVTVFKEAQEAKAHEAREKEKEKDMPPAPTGRGETPVFEQPRSSNDGGEQRVRLLESAQQALQMQLEAERRARDEDRAQAERRLAMASQSDKERAEWFEGQMREVDRERREALDASRQAEEKAEQEKGLRAKLQAELEEATRKLERERKAWEEKEKKRERERLEREKEKTQTPAPAPASAPTPSPAPAQAPTGHPCNICKITLVTARGYRDHCTTQGHMAKAAAAAAAAAAATAAAGAGSTAGMGPEETAASQQAPAQKTVAKVDAATLTDDLPRVPSPHIQADPSMFSNEFLAYNEERERGLQQLREEVRCGGLQHNTLAVQVAALRQLVQGLKATARGSGEDGGDMYVGMLGDFRTELGEAFAGLYFPDIPQQLQIAEAHRQALSEGPRRGSIHDYVGGLRELVRSNRVDRRVVATIKRALLLVPALADLLEIEALRSA